MTPILESICYQWELQKDSQALKAVKDHESAVLKPSQDSSLSLAMARSITVTRFHDNIAICMQALSGKCHHLFALACSMA